MVEALSRPSWRGRTNVDAMTIAAIEYAESLAGHTFVVTQGSYQSSVAASAGTHDRGGAVDIRWDGHDSDVLALRRAGFAAWHRWPAQGPWVDHIHAVLIGHPDLAPSAARQVTSYYAGRNGLASNAADDGPRLNPIPTFTWPPKEIDMTPDEARTVIREELDAALGALGTKRIESPKDDGPKSRALSVLLFDIRDDLKAQNKALAEISNALKDLAKAAADATRKGTRQ